MKETADEAFEKNLLRGITASLYFLNTLTAAREMFGKSYFSLGAFEKNAVDQAVIGFVAGTYQGITPAALAAQEAPKGAGFLAPGAKQSAEKT
jgi:hypothetical protein